MDHNIKQRQIEVCNEFGADYWPCPNGLKVGISENVKEGMMPVNGMRIPPEGDTTGWYIWSGEELPDDADFFLPLAIDKVYEWCPIIVQYLGLPPGWRFLTAIGYEDIWKDDSLLKL